jgi:short-subunit dehydrogenase
LKANTDIDYVLDEFFLNFESMAIPALLCAEYFEKRQKGQIIGISSVAGERGRKTIYIYGSAKSAFTSLMSGLRGRLAPHNIHVMTVKPGLIETPMTSHLPKSPLFISSTSAANIIYKGMINRKDSIYVPFYWRFIMRIIKDLPEFIFKKLSI